MEIGTKILKKDTEGFKEYSLADIKAAIRVICKRLSITEEEIEAEK